jgi:hypothetical protein
VAAEIVDAFAKQGFLQRGRLCEACVERVRGLPLDASEKEGKAAASSASSSSSSSSSMLKPDAMKGAAAAAADVDEEPGPSDDASVLARIGKVFMQMASAGFIKPQTTADEKQQVHNLNTRKRKRETEANIETMSQKKRRTASVASEDMSAALADDTQQLLDDRLQRTNDLIEADVDTTCYTICFDTFLRLVQNNMLHEFVAKYSGEFAATVVRLVLDEYPSRIDGSPPLLSLGQIRGLLLKHCAMDISSGDLSQRLAEICAFPHFDIMQQGEYGYRVLVHHLLDELRMMHVRAIVKERYGTVAARVFQLLNVHQQAEEKSITELATAPKEAVRKALYAMQLGGFVACQVIPRTTDRHPARSFYLWGVPKSHLFGLVLTSLYQSAVNLRLRLHKESTDAVIVKILAKHLEDETSLDTEETQKLVRFQRTESRLQTCVSRMDKLIYLFDDLSK